MKRIFCLLLACCIVLSLWGCGNESPEDTTAPSTTEPSTEPVAVTEPEPAVFSLKKLPEIGDYVSDEKVAYFFPDGAHETFEPRDDYGEIVPYYGHTSVFREVPRYEQTDEDGKEYTIEVENRALSYGSGVGMMTRDGRIICKPIYEYYEEAEDFSGKKIWELHIPDPEEMFSYTPVVIAGDGSWMIEAEKDQYVSFYTEGPFSYFSLLTNGNEGQIDRKLYSFDGKLLADLDQIGARFETKKEKLRFKSVEQDRLLFEFYRPADDDDSDEQNMSRRYIYTDYKGTKLSIFSLPVPFEERYGNCILGYDGIGGMTQLFDLNGEPLHKKVNGYSYFDEKNQRILICEKDEGIVHVYDTDGKPLMQYEMDWDLLECSSNGAVFLDRSEKKLYSIVDGSEIDLHLPDIEVLDTVYEELRHYNGGDKYITALTQSGDCYLFDLDGNQIAKMHKPDYKKETYGDEDDDYYYDIDLYVTKDYVVSVSEKYGWFLYDFATNEERKLPLPTMNLHFDENEREKPFARLQFFGNQMQAYLEILDDELGEFAHEDIYDLRTGRRIYSDLQMFDQTQDLILFTTKRAAVALEKDGSVLLKINSNSLF